MPVAWSPAVHIPPNIPPKTLQKPFAPVRFAQAPYTPAPAEKKAERDAAFMGGMMGPFIGWGLYILTMGVYATLVGKPDNSWGIPLGATMTAASTAISPVLSWVRQRRRHIALATLQGRFRPKADPQA